MLRSQERLAGKRSIGFGNLELLLNLAKEVPVSRGGKVHWTRLKGRRKIRWLRQCVWIVRNLCIKENRKTGQELMFKKFLSVGKYWNLFVC